MKLTLTPLRLRLKRPLTTAQGNIDERAGFEVSFTQEGVTGRGEAMPLEFFGTESLIETTSALRTFECHQVPRSVDEAHAATESLAATPAARCAAESALLEWLALRAGKPVAALFDGSTKTLVVNAVVTGSNMAEMTEHAVKLVAQGFKTLKVKVAASSLDVDAQRLASIRRAVGPNVKLRIDANGGWSEARARSALRGLESLNLELCEQPVPPQDIEGMRRLRHDVDTPIAADETLIPHAAIDRVLLKDPRCAADVLILKPMALGGIVRTVQIAQRAQAVGVSTIVTTLFDGPIGRAIATHAALALGPTSFAHGLSTLELIQDSRPDALTPREGMISAPTEAGWGVASWGSLAH